MAAFYVDHLGFTITGTTPDLLSLEGNDINLYLERGASRGPVLEVMVPDVDETKLRLLQNGCQIMKDEPQIPRCHVKDPFGLTYNLRKQN